MKKILIIVLAFMLVSVLGSFASNSGMMGREVVEMGVLQTIEGSLVEQDGEWYLQTGEFLYAVHLGNHDFIDSLEMDLNEGDRVTLQGFVQGEDIAAVNITTGGKTYLVRSEDGMPLWAGNGQGRNRQSDEGRGMNGSGKSGQGNSGNCDDECSEENDGGYGPNKS